MPGLPAAKQGDRVVAVDQHMIQPPGAPPPPPVLVPHPFSGLLDAAVSRNVRINGRPAATVDSLGTNTPSHIPIGGTFVDVPTNRARVVAGSTSVRINGKPAARATDAAETCNFPAPKPVGKLVAVGTVRIGG
jgi:uncharacterized Zn-binding protein involved in type VI secretion